MQFAFAALQDERPVGSQLDVRRGRFRRTRLPHQPFQERGHVDWNEWRLVGGRFQAREFEQVVHDLAHARGLAAHVGERILPFGREPALLAELVEIARDHGERRAQFMRGIRDEVLAHLLEPRLARHVAHQQQELAASGDDDQRQPGLAALHADHDAVAASAAPEVIGELGLPDQVLDRHAAVRPCA